ncbi:MAG: metal-dependent hydrolase [Candidatus Woesearchaeota archaeon]
MKFKEHLAINAITFFPLLLFAESFLDVFIYINILIFAIIPDLDYYKKFSILKIFPFLLSLFFLRKPKHRDVFHSIFSSLLVSFLLPLLYLFFLKFDQYLTIVFYCFLSYSLHLLLDSFTVSGVKPFLPFSEKKFSGSLRNTTTILILIILLIAQIVLYPILRKETIIFANFLLIFCLRFII